MQHIGLGPFVADLDQAPESALVCFFTGLGFLKGVYMEALLT